MIYGVYFESLEFYQVLIKIYVRICQVRQATEQLYDLGSTVIWNKESTGPQEPAATQYIFSKNKNFVSRTEI